MAIPGVHVLVEEAPGEKPPLLQEKLIRVVVKVLAFAQEPLNPEPHAVFIRPMLKALVVEEGDFGHPSPRNRRTL